VTVKYNGARTVLDIVEMKVEMKRHIMITLTCPLSSTALVKEIVAFQTFNE
jgi:hypothetical protein